MGSGYKDTCHNYLTINSDTPVTHVRLNIYPGESATTFYDATYYTYTHWEGKCLPVCILLH